MIRREMDEVLREASGGEGEEEEGHASFWGSGAAYRINTQSVQNGLRRCVHVCIALVTVKIIPPR